MNVAHLRRWLALACTVVACSEAAPGTPSVSALPPRDGTGGAAGTELTSGGGGEDEAIGGENEMGPGGRAGGAKGEGGEATRGDAGAAGAAGSAGGAGEPDDDANAPEPVCMRGLTWASAERLSVSMAGDDVLQSLTPDGLTLMWKNDGRLYVADRSSTAESFGQPSEVPAELGFDSASLSPDGLRLIGSRDLGFTETVREARGEAFSALSDDQAFVPFNRAVMGTPTDELALEPLLSADASHLVYSFVSPSNADARPTLYETEWLGQWSFGTALAGQKLLWSTGSERRLATGLSSDRLTLFYWDELEGELRAAWRARTDRTFSSFERQGTMLRAAPNGSCTELYYSDEGTAGLDLFQARRE